MNGIEDGRTKTDPSRGRSAGNRSSAPSEDAVRCFLATEIDVLVPGNFILLLGVLIYLSGTAASPFIYTLF